MISISPSLHVTGVIPVVPVNCGSIVWVEAGDTHPLPSLTTTVYVPGTNPVNV